MRRSRLVALFSVTVSVLAGACGSGSSPGSALPASAPTSVRPTVKATASTAPPGAGRPSAVADICSRKASATPPVSGQTVDYAQAAKDLQYTVDNAPAEIKPDITTLAQPLEAYWQILADNKGSVAAAAQDPRFRTLLARFGQDDYKTAADSVQKWFAAHC